MASIPKSPNFNFLDKHDPILVRYASQAERYVFDDPNTALFKLRQFAEVLAQHAAAYSGLYVENEDNLLAIINRLWNRGILTDEVSQLFHQIRKVGNAAVHKNAGTQGEALHQLKFARTLAVWFHKTFGHDPSFKPGGFVPPPEPKDATQELQEELKHLQAKLIEYEDTAKAAKETAKAAKETAKEEARRRAEAQAKAQEAYNELSAAMELAEETEAQLHQQKIEFEDRLQALQAKTASATKEQMSLIVESAKTAGEDLDLDEADTRKIVDSQLRDAGWEADTQAISYKKGVRPQKGKNLAIAEWPTEKGPADYVLFAGLKPLAIVEAKRKVKDVPGIIEQAKRYSKGYTIKADEVLPGGPWGDYKIPFLFATNARPYLKQIQTKSGIWFLDARISTNHPYPLLGWYSPEGLLAELQKDKQAANEKLKQEPTDYLPLRDYQAEAVHAVEKGIEEGRREIMVAMATGTGKTITCLGLVYRLCKVKRFRRILFLVDRTALGDQATGAFKDVRLENLQSFADIYDIKELGDVAPEPDTRLQVATIQGMIKRLLFPSDENSPIPVDQYDCIVIDECHRGYNLDREMSDAELTFRSEMDYVSKYTRVLEYFDAVKIGLTATPALHTTEIFGPPIFTYSYRQAVVDGWLSDHEPPIRIVTQLAEEGIKWAKGEEMQVYDAKNEQLSLFQVPDDVKIEIDEFNKRVVTEPFNETICRELVHHIDPELPGKTLIFCATDAHADIVVDKLKKAFDEEYGEIEDDAVVKITGASDKPLELIRRYKNERLPSIAVTVDLLTTGVDVPEIVNIVFMRRVRSRILYEQMLGRGTRLCPGLFGEGEDKERFKIFDAVDLYAALDSHNTMKPVVVNPNIPFAQLVNELETLEDEEALKQVKDQLLAKLNRKKSRLKGKSLENFQTLAGGTPSDFIKELRQWTPKQITDWFAEHSELLTFLDKVTMGGQKIVISEHEDQFRRVERGYGESKKPEDYLESFKKFIQDNINEIPALMIVTQRPRELTRKQLKELKLTLDNAGYTEPNLETAYRETTNQDIAASIIGYIRGMALGSPLVPYSERVDRAMQKIIASTQWTAPQRKWLERIGKQLKVETIVDRDSLDKGSFAAQGGFNRLNKVFDGKLQTILDDINEELWAESA
ncbi:type I restriction enzyme, R subunit [Desulfatibacillum alkenivorans DSM 16219]|jgi:type I restriction enzyme R subunit|uniref:Type I restriction enzyme, R subunit n=1 Tax=Desulfatibacillum alkenivorans DSM 16219 TaxID=1121393 RepID=A0A1M6Q9Y2_9BACT|nr:type I restriction-modification system endonuclease [Desulfatibacillum alkenivorans]SHK16893.1 type I restriction enzyme, R subunit [Desulfatibacillum alkenivorans DSM 16219]